MVQEGLYDIYDVWHVPFWQTRTWYLFICFLVIFLIFVCLVCLRWLIGKKRRTNDYWTDTLNALHELEITVNDGSDCALFYVDLTRIMKNYLWMRFQFNAFGKTEHEIESLVQQLMLPGLLMHDFCVLLGRSTLAKFSQSQITVDQKKHDLNVCFELLTATRPVTIDEK